MKRHRLLVALQALVACASWTPSAHSDIDDLTARALTSALLGDTATLREATEAIQRVDGALHEADQEASGLADNFLTLHAAVTLRGTPEFAPAQHDAARLAGTSAERRRLRAVADADPWATIGRLRWENGFNRFAGAFNWLVRRSVQLLTGQTQTLLHMANDLIFSARPFLYPTARERKIHALAERVAAESPAGPRADAARDLARALDRKLERDRRRDLLRRCRVALQTEQWELAEALAEAGLVLWPSDDSFRECRRDADHHLASRRRGWRRSLEVVPLGESELDGVDWADLGDAQRAWLTGEDETALEILQVVIEEAAAGNPIVDDALTLAAAAHARSGDPEAARRRLRSVRGGGGRLAWRAEAMLTNPPLEPGRELNDALERRGRLTRRFVLTGARGVEDHLYLASSSTISQGLAAPMALGFLFFIDSTIRGVAVAFHNPIGAEEVVDALTRLERREGDLPDEHRAMLRDRLRDLGAYGRALEVHDGMSAPDPAVRRRLVERLADQRLQGAESVSDAAVRRRALAHVVEQYPGTSAAQRAWRQLHEAPWRGAHLSLEDLGANGAALRDAGWPIDPALWDADPSNGELTSDGVWLEDDGTVHSRRSGMRGWETTRVNQDDMARVRAAVAAISRRREVTETIDARRRPLVPLEITGSLGASGVYAAPQLQRYRHVDDDLPLYD